MLSFVDLILHHLHSNFVSVLFTCSCSVAFLLFPVCIFCCVIVVLITLFLILISLSFILIPFHFSFSLFHFFFNFIFNLLFYHCFICKHIRSIIVIFSSLLSFEVSTMLISLNPSCLLRFTLVSMPLLLFLQKCAINSNFNGFIHPSSFDFIYFIFLLFCCFLLQLSHLLHLCCLMCLSFHYYFLVDIIAMSLSFLPNSPIFHYF